MRELKPSFCRCCINQCSILVDVDDGHVLAVHGNPDNPQYQGYSCIKGRSQGAYLSAPDRVLRPLRRKADGTHEEVTSDAALNEIAESLVRLRDRHGPRSIASYWGTMASVGNFGAGMPFFTALLDAIGTNMRFDPNTIDKGGKQSAQSFLGYWGAPAMGFDRPDAILLIGINPLLTYTGFPSGSPKRWLAETLARGCQLIVIDPRESHVAAQATHFLQARPGNDALIMAAILKVVIEEKLYDRAFVDAHVTGLDTLRTALHSIDVAAVADTAGVSANLLADSARTYARARRGYAMAGTGPHMSGFGTLIEYLVLVLETICGRWLRAGDVVKASPSLLPAFSARAQARGPDPDWALAGRMRVRGLKQSRAGMPTAALAEEMLLPGEGRVRSLLCWGGNPAMAFPDQQRTIEALKSLELFVTIDPWFTESGKLAHYVLPPPMGLEVETATIFMDWLSGRATGYGQGQAHAQYTQQIARRPQGSDLLEEWQIFYELMVRMGYPVEVLPFGRPPEGAKVRFDARPSNAELLEKLTEGSRVPLDVIKSNRHGHIYDDGLIVVQPGDPANTARLEVGHPEMLAWLSEVVGAQSARSPSNEFRLLCRRENHVYNSSCNRRVTNKGRFHNPAFLHADDMAHLGVVDGDEVELSSELGKIRALVSRDDHVLPGTVSMAFAYGDAQNPEADPVLHGASPNRLIPTDRVYDPYTGQPRMTNVGVQIMKATADQSLHDA
nr:molybdopterin-dependent oxidoreductase [Sphingomonas sp. CCH9-E2]